MIWSASIPFRIATNAPFLPFACLLVTMVYNSPWERLVSSILKSNKIPLFNQTSQEEGTTTFASRLSNPTISKSSSCGFILWCFDTFFEAILPSKGA